MEPRQFRFALVAVLVGALIAAAEGFQGLACASTVRIVTVIAASFGAGAALTALIAQRRTRPPGGPAR